jgi:hypothetical protein
MRKVILRPNGTTNVPLLVVHHSSTGFSWGNTGAGAADLALNVLEWYLRGKKFYGLKPPYRKEQCSIVAYDLHQKFKHKFIAPMPKEGGTIPHDAIKAWVEKQVFIRLCKPMKLAPEFLSQTLPNPYHTPSR